MFVLDVSGAYPFPGASGLPNDLSPNAYPQGMLHNNISPGLNNYPRMVCIILAHGCLIMANYLHGNCFVFFTAWI